MLPCNHPVPAPREISPPVIQNILQYKMYSSVLHKPNIGYSLSCPQEVSAELEQTKQQGQGALINVGQKQWPIGELTKTWTHINT